VQTGAKQLAETLEEARSLKTQLEEARSLKKSVEAGEAQTCKVRVHGCKQMPVGDGLQDYKKWFADKKDRYHGMKANEITKLAGDAQWNAEEKVKRLFVDGYRAKLEVWKRQRSHAKKRKKGVGEKELREEEVKDNDLKHKQEDLEA
jgi:hypothetical protein